MNGSGPRPSAAARRAVLLDLLENVITAQFEAESAVDTT